MSLSYLLIIPCKYHVKEFMLEIFYIYKYNKQNNFL